MDDDPAPQIEYEMTVAGTAASVQFSVSKLVADTDITNSDILTAPTSAGSRPLCTRYYIIKQS